jgi:hypothetical protein
MDATLKVSMRIPGEAASFDFSVFGQTPRHFKANADNVYSTVTELAVEQMLGRLEKLLIREGAPAAPSGLSTPSRDDAPSSPAPSAQPESPGRTSSPGRRDM